MKKENRLFEYRIKYSSGAGYHLAALDSYRYYMAENASQAFDFHQNSMLRSANTGENLSVERKNPWSGEWEDVSQVIDHRPAAIENED